MDTLAASIIAISYTDESSDSDSEEDTLSIISPFHQLQATLADGSTVLHFSSLQGKYVLIVNVASQCGFSYHMNGLEQIHQRYHRDVQVLGFPSNDFHQERKSMDKTLVCYRQKYDVTFPVMEKVRVNGKDAHQVYQWLKQQRKGVLGMRRITWNFEKFLVDREGRVVKRYLTFTNPREIMEDLDLLLKMDKERRLTASL